MYKCEDCNSFFPKEEREAKKEMVGEFWGDPAYETYYVCPHCGSDDLVEIEPCPICGSLEHEYYETYCVDCNNNIIEKMNDVVKANFSTEEIELVRKLYKGEWNDD